MNRAENKQGGFAMIWAAVTLLIISILVAAMLAISLSHTERSLGNNQEKQAYFTARSAVNAVSSKICESGGNLSGLIPRVGASLTLDEFQFDGDTDHKMGTCNVTLTRESKEHLLIKATAKYAGATRTVALRLNRIEESGLPSGIICGSLRSLKDKNSGGGDNGANQYGDGVKRLKTEPGADIYVAEDGVSLQTGALLRGNLYSSEGIDIGTKSGREKSHVHGEVRGMGDVNLKNTIVGAEKDPCGVTDCGEGQLTSAVRSKNTVTLSDKAKVYGDVTAQKIDVKGGTSISGKQDTAGYEKAFELPLVLVSILDDASINSPVLTSEDSVLENSEYIVPDGNTVNIEVLDISALEDKPILIHIGEGSTLNIKNLMGGNSYYPNLYIILDQRASFVFNSSNDEEAVFTGYVLGVPFEPKEGEEDERPESYWANTTAEFGNGTKIFGGVSVRSLFLGSGVTVALSETEDADEEEPNAEGFLGIVADEIRGMRSATVTMSSQQGQPKGSVYLKTNDDLMSFNIDGDFYCQDEIGMNSSIASKGVLKATGEVWSGLGSSGISTEYVLEGKISEEVWLASQWPKMPTASVPSGQTMVPLTEAYLDSTPLGEKGGTSYYHVTTEVKGEVPTMKILENSGDIYIVIEKDQQLNIRTMELEGGVRWPNVYFILADAAVLVINGKGEPSDFHGYVYPDSERTYNNRMTMVNFEDDEGNETVNAWGAIYCNMILTKNMVDFHYIPPSAKPSVPVETPNLNSSVRWEQLEYVRGEGSK